ncbi:MAG TPA: hypothetical protein VM123_00710 [archaeon]|nr:hypothetical protein [archaeon]
MTLRERVLKTLAHEQPDICPWHISFTIPAREKLCAFLGVDDLDRAVGNHLAKIEAVPDDGWREIRPDFWQDEFGVVWDRTLDKDIGNVDHSALVLLAHSYLCLRQSYAPEVTDRPPPKEAMTALKQNIPPTARGFPSTGQKKYAALRRVVLEELFEQVISIMTHSRDDL